MTRVADWLKNPPSGHPYRTDVEALLREEATQLNHSCMFCQTTPDCQAMLEHAANKVLQKSCLLKVKRVNDFSGAARHLAHVVQNQVLTDEQLDHLMDLAPGGTPYLKQTGAAQLRARLKETAVEHPGPGPEWTCQQVAQHIGPDVLQPFMKHRVGTYPGTVPKRHRLGLKKGMLEAANKTLSDPHTYMSTFIMPAMLETRDTDQKRRDLAYLAEIGTQRCVTGPLWLPKAATMQKRLKTWIGTNRASFNDSTRQQADTLKLALCPSLHYRQPYRGFRGRLLRNVVWERLVETTRLPGATRTADSNIALLGALTGPLPDRATLHSHNELWSMCKNADLDEMLRSPTRQQQRRTGPRARIAGPDIGDVASTVVDELADVYLFFDTYVKRHGKLPAYGAINPYTADAIEEHTGKQFGELLQELHDEHGWKLPSRSSNEQAMDQMILDTFSDTAEQYTTEWSGWEQRWRIDGMIPVAVNQIRLDGSSEQFELFVEADGEQHFGQVRNWDLNETRRRDIVKAEAIGLRARKQKQPCLLIALHHRCLTGRRTDRVTPDRFLQCVHQLRDSGHWWATVRPEGCKDERAAPGSTVRYPSLWPNLEIRVLQYPDQILGE